MEEIVFIGDELSAAAYRMTGIRTLIVEPEETESALENLGEARLVLLASPHAAAMGRTELMARIRRARPMLMVVRDAAGSEPLPDFATLLRQRLGVAT